MPDTCLNITAYHGTLVDRATRIEATGFNKSNKEVEWLGYGVYFFDRFDNARYWALQEHTRQKGPSSSPVVLMVTICIEKNSLLDLDDPNAMYLFKSDLNEAFESMFGDGKSGAPRFKNEREQRCFWCNYFTRTHPNIKVIAYSFPRIYYDKFGIPSVHQNRQLCVVDDTCIRMPPKRLEVLA